MGGLRARLALLGSIVGVVSMVLSACGGAQATATPKAASTQAPTATRPPAAPATATPTTQAAPTATSAASRPTAAATAGPQATATPRPAPTPVPTLAAKPKYGGQLTRLISGTVDEKLTGPLTNPKLGTGTSNPVVLSYLFTVDLYGDFSIIGGVAQSWEFSKDLMTLTVRLRPDAQWSDDTPFTSKDVKYTFDTIAAPPAGWSSKYKFFATSTIASIDTPDPKTAVFHLKAPSVSWLVTVSEVEFYMLPAHVSLTDFSNGGVVSGPFKPKSFDLDVKREFARNDRYWEKSAQGDKLPYIDGVLDYVIADVSARYAAFLAGKIDLLNDRNSLFGKEKELQAKFPGLYMPVTMSGSYGIFYKNQPPFDDARVRQAVNLIIDRAHAVRIAWESAATYDAPGVRPSSFGGQYAIPVAEMVKIPGLRYVDKAGTLATSIEDVIANPDKWRKDPMDVQKGIQLLKEAGFDVAKGEFPIKSIYTSDRYGPQAVALAAGVQQQPGLSAVSIKSDIVPVGAWGPDMRAGKWTVALAAIYAGGHVDDPSYFLQNWTTGVNGVQASPTGLSSPAFDDLYKQQDQSVDLAQRKLVSLKLQRLIWTELLNPLPLYHTISPYDAYRPYVKNPPPRRSSGEPTTLARLWLDK